MSFYDIKYTRKIIKKYGGNMNNTDLTFFTNEPERNLYDRFAKILNRNTQFFDVLVGYFRASGFYLLQDALEKVEKTRILIGINTDKQIVNMYEEVQGEIKEFSLSNKESITKYKKSLEIEFEKSADTEKVENGVNKFVSLIKEGKLEIRIYTKQPIHAKIYVMRDYKDSPDFGRVITGSSNFSQSGLVNNLEFNVELKNSADVQFALDKFEELWRESVEINQECVDTIENKTWIKSDITPYEMYVKFLYEYFKEEINDDLIDSSKDYSRFYPDGFVPLQYQKDAVIQAKRILEKHNGIFISDVVGLGKTYICAMLGQELEGRSLFLCPPVLVDYWDRVLSDFGVRGYKVESEGKLDKIIEEGSEQYRYVFVDESHRFRNAETEQYKQLHEICVGKKVVLISATPQNNYNTDIANQLYLFQSKNKSTIVNARNLELFFDTLRKKVRVFEKDTEEYKQAIRETSEEIRDKVLREVMIRRTRTEIQKTYAEDLKKQGLRFPKVSDPKKLIYKFSENTEKVFETTIKTITELNYSRYKPLTYVKESKLQSSQKSLLVGQANMGGFMKGILIKRLESSKYAFEMTLNRFIDSYNEFISMYRKNGVVWVSKKYNVSELVNNEDFEKLEQAAINEDAFKFKAEDFDKSFINDLEKDLSLLQNLKDIWNKIKIDDKLEYFINELKVNKNLKNDKIIIFTESKETAEYLTRSIQDRLNEKVILFSGSMPDSIRSLIRANFDPTYNRYRQKNEYRILVTTDVLAEGMNLHRSNVIINYDLPWNPTKIMQRVGRINRVGTEHDAIYVYNFFPTSKSNEQMSLEENIITKMQMFYDILGEDSKFLTEDEEVSTHELFRRMTTIVDDEDDKINSELSYLKEIRTIRDKDKELFEKIRNYPKKIKIGRKKEDLEGLITFFRKGYLKKFYISNTEETKEVTFEQAIEYVKATKSEQSKKVRSDYYDLLKNNKLAFEISEKEEIDNDILSVNKKGTSNAKNIIKILKECLKLDYKFTDIEIDKINKTITLLENGELPVRIVKDANKEIKKITGINDIIKFYKELEKMIPKVYYEQETKVETNIKKSSNKEKEIILSEYVF